MVTQHLNEEARCETSTMKVMFETCENKINKKHLEVVINEDGSGIEFIKSLEWLRKRRVKLTFNSI